MNKLAQYLGTLLLEKNTGRLHAASLFLSKRVNLTISGRPFA